MTIVKQPRKTQAAVSFSIEEELWLNYETLCMIADRGIDWDYNRQLSSEGIRTIPKNSIYRVAHFFEHHHRCFEPCEPHMRLVIELPKALGFADIPITLFKSLKRSFVVRRGQSAVLVALPIGKRRLKLFTPKKKTHNAEAIHLLKTRSPDSILVA